jgi:hypothetical protein
MVVHRRITFFFVAALLGASQAFAGPAQIVIIRHAEKPATGNEVTQQGCERAFSLPDFFQSNKIVNQFGLPVAVFAAQPASDDSSIRPIQTISPTAKALGVKVQDPATNLDYETIKSAINSNAAYDGKTVLIAWEHKAIPGLAEAFGVTLTQATKKWPGTVFDEAWVIDFSKSGETSLQIIPEQALPGDNPLGGADWADGPSPDSTQKIPQNIVSECQNNDALNALVAGLADPPVPSAPAPAAAH